MTLSKRRARTLLSESDPAQRDLFYKLMRSDLNASWRYVHMYGEHLAYRMISPHFVASINALVATNENAAVEIYYAMGRAAHALKALETTLNTFQLSQEDTHE